LLAAVLLVGTMLVSGCGSAEQISAPLQADYGLGQYAEPQFLALADDGAVWVTDTFSDSIHKVDPEGGVTEYRLPEAETSFEFPRDIVEGPDRAMWFTTSGPLGRIDPTGKMSEGDSETTAYAIAATDDGLWVTTTDESSHIARLDVDGKPTSVVDLPPDDLYELPGIAKGSDGSAWFTQASFGTGKPPDAIGQVAPDRSYTRWPLPRPLSGPARITSGPDDTLWFTEQLAHQIGRITTQGEVTEFPLPKDVSPVDITEGRDGALWFTTDTCLGRITTNGDITLWPVAGAKALVGIAPAPDGSFWLADSIGHAVRHITPPKPAKASETPCEPPNIEVKAGSTHAKVIYRRLDTFEDGEDFIADIRIRISRKGEALFSETVPEYSGYPKYRVFGYTGSVDAVDLDGDGEPEVMLELNWNGTHCCFWWRVYRYDPKRDTYVPGTHFWGNADTKPKLRDLDADRRLEIVSKDDSFSKLIGYAGSVRPIQVWAYEDGRFSDVTRKYPEAIEQDAARLWRLYLEYRQKFSPRYVLAAWAADQYMLGRDETAERVLVGALERGELDAEFGDPEDGAGYLTKLQAFLRKNGYIRD
jgi:virginiamycin B lyase